MQYTPGECVFLLLFFAVDLVKRVVMDRRGLYHRKCLEAIRKRHTDTSSESTHIKMTLLEKRCQRSVSKIMIQLSEILHEKAIFLSVVLILAADLRK